MPAAMSWSAAKRAFFLDLLELVRLDPNARSRHPLPQHLSSFVEDAGCTLLFLLADTTRTQLSDRVAEGIAAMLLRAGADPLLQGGTQGRHPLHQDMPHPGIVRLLLKAGADPNAQDSRGQRPLHVTACAMTVEELIACGADVHARDKRGRTPLDVACHARVEAALRAGGAQA